MGLSLLKGIITGIILSLPFGPVGLYCIELTMVEGRWKGYMAAMGMVTIDVLYAIISLLFISKVETIIIKYEYFLTLIIGLFLMYIALKKILSKTEIKEVRVEIKNMVQNYFTGIFFALANITSIVMITVIFTTLKVYNDESSTHIYETLLGVFIGGATMWFFTTRIFAGFRKNLNKKRMSKLIKGVNILLFTFSLILVIKTLFKWLSF
ncbi:MAG: LysE family transporter [Fusobacterium sp.]|uniref:LysE family translocator n=1 Tax=Fusobacterium sp. TaxID=68766 RepID=UPI0026DA8737|nr:LysE family transporter [Fusobacterium sp.]MDO4690118.1 LysE family transporter [Fusobacterium sp.]